MSVKLNGKSRIRLIILKQINGDNKNKKVFLLLKLIINV